MNHCLFLKIKLRSYRDVEGFSLVEVLISILMIAGFLATAMQALIAATAIKVKSEEISEATTWMQEDLEAIKFEANRFGFNSATNTYNPDLDGNGTPDECAGFAEPLKDFLEDDSAANSPLYKYGNGLGQRKESAIGGRPYIIVRELVALSPGATTGDPNILKIKHEVFTDRDGDLSSSGEGDPIGELYSEIIPDVAFSCS